MALGVQELAVCRLRMKWFGTRFFAWSIHAKFSKNRCAVLPVARDSMSTEKTVSTFRAVGAARGNGSRGDQEVLAGLENKDEPCSRCS
jgi:hypothetical protein